MIFTHVHVKAQFFTLVLFLYFWFAQRQLEWAMCQPQPPCTRLAAFFLRPADLSQLVILLWCAAARESGAACTSDIPWFASEVFLNHNEVFLDYALVAMQQYAPAAFNKHYKTERLTLWSYFIVNILCKSTHFTHKGLLETIRNAQDIFKAQKSLAKSSVSLI